MAALALFFSHLVTWYRTEQLLSTDQLRSAKALLQLKESFVYLILTDAPVVDLDFTRF